MNKFQHVAILIVVIVLTSAQRYEPVATKRPFTPSTTTAASKTTATISPYASTLKRAAVPQRATVDTSKVKRQFPPYRPPYSSPYNEEAFPGPRPNELLFQYSQTGPDGSVAYGFGTNEMEQHDQTIITDGGIPERRGRYTIQFPDKSEQTVEYLANQNGYQPIVTNTKGPGGVPLVVPPPAIPASPAALYPSVQPLYEKKVVKVEEYIPSQSSFQPNSPYQIPAPYVEETQEFSSSTISPVASASTVQPLTYASGQQSGGFYVPFQPSQPAVSNWNERVVPIGQRPQQPLHVQPLNSPYRIPEPHFLYGNRGPPPPPPPPSQYPYGGSGYHSPVPSPHPLYNSGHIESPHYFYGNGGQPPVVPPFVRGGNPGQVQPPWLYPPQYPKTVQPAQFPVNQNGNFLNYRQETILKCTDATSGNAPLLG